MVCTLLAGSDSGDDSGDNSGDDSGDEEASRNTDGSGSDASGESSSRRSDSSGSSDSIGDEEEKEEDLKAKVFISFLNFLSSVSIEISSLNAIF